MSFLAFAPERAVEAWTVSIRAAEERSLLGGILTSRHFCLLAPSDGEAHRRFREEEERRLKEHEAECGVERAELERYVAAFGFCDLISPCLCSGMREEVLLPVAHPADQAAATAAAKVRMDLRDKVVRFDRAVVRVGTRVPADGWRREAEGEVVSERMEWSFG